MTDQFSPEYIAYILSDEAKGLQEGHFLGLGEWRLMTPIFKDDRPWLVTDGGKGYGLTARGIYIDGSLAACMYARERSVWLPTLWDLLQIIEGAGWEWQRRSNHQWRIYKKGEPLNCLVLDDVGDDMLAAAKLAVRAIGKE